MKEDGFPYCIPDKRDLTEIELSLLDYLLKQIDDVTVDASDLKVVARCGCGQCPTILFGKSIDDEPITSRDSQPFMDWSGRAENGTLVGIGVFTKDGMPTELAAWSVDGGDVETWPPIDEIRRT
jgi:hypothetical protein